MFSRKLILAVSILALVFSSGFSRNILEKKIFYVNNVNKTGQAKFWVIYLGGFDVNLTRKIPGEGDVPVQATVNLQLISSGYVEGNGYGTKGKVDCLPTLLFVNNGEERRVVLDSIDYIYDFGRKVQLKTGETGDLILDIEGNKVSAKKFIMREYKLTNYYGEEILKEGSQESAIIAIALSQDGLVKAQKAQATLDAGAQQK
ncbi:MAG TPA: hypothetical protein VKO63_07670 [Chitinispirillaceae bacterium]|jgi:hypothetical protein|nr:hypothetical protein [Chitinispirillaceae bacterium]